MFRKLLLKATNKITLPEPRMNCNCSLSMNYHNMKGKQDNTKAFIM